MTSAPETAQAIIGDIGRLYPDGLPTRYGSIDRIKGCVDGIGRVLHVLVRDFLPEREWNRLTREQKLALANTYEAFCMAAETVAHQGGVDIGQQVPRRSIPATNDLVTWSCYAQRVATDFGFYTHVTDAAAIRLAVRALGALAALQPLAHLLRQDVYFGNNLRHVGLLGQLLLEGAPAGRR